MLAGPLYIEKFKIKYKSYKFLNLHKKHKMVKKLTKQIFIEENSSKKVFDMTYIAIPLPDEYYIQKECYSSEVAPLEASKNNFNVEYLKRNLSLSYRETVNCSKKTAENSIKLLELSGAFEKNYLIKTNEKIRLVFSIFKINFDEIKYFQYFLQSSLQDKFFNRNGKERWDVDIQNFVTTENIDEIIYLIKQMSEFIKTKQLKSRINNAVVLGASLDTMINRLKFAIQNSTKNIIILTSDRPVFSKKIIKIINGSKNCFDVDYNFNKEQELLMEYYKNNFSCGRFLEDLNSGLFTEDYMAIVAEKIIKQENFLSNDVIIKTIESRKTAETKGRRRANTIDTIFEYIDNGNYVFRPVFISNQPHIMSQYSQIKAIFNTKNFHKLKKEIYINCDGNYVYRGYIIKNYKHFYRNFMNLAVYGFDVAGDGIDYVFDINYNASSQEDKKNILNNIKLILQNIAGSFNSYQLERMSKMENNVLKSNFE